MSFKHFEHQADVGIIGIGKTLEEAFQEGAKAMFQVMADLKTIVPQILSTAESKMLETISENYYNEHFDLKRVNIKPFLQKI